MKSVLKGGYGLLKTAKKRTSFMNDPFEKVELGFQI